MVEVKKLKYFAGGEFLESKTAKYMDVTDSSTGAVIAKAPCCTIEEVEYAIQCAKKAYKTWSDTPVMKRCQVLYNFRELIMKNIDELTYMSCQENGKSWGEARGCILKIKEMCEHAAATPTLMMGDTMRDTSSGYDTVTFREPLGVFAGICPWNMPGMIPSGWMAPLCIATGNTMVIKAASPTPLSALRHMELWKEAGLPDGVLNVVTCSRHESELLLRHPDIVGITFVGSTEVGAHIYAEAAAHGKRVQCLTSAKNYGLVLEDAPLDRTVDAVMNSTFGCAGERCMALPTICVQESIADEFVKRIVAACRNRKVGPAYDKDTELGPIVTKEHKDFILSEIEKGIAQGADLVLDGRNVVIKGYENGYYLGPTIFDHVTNDMSIGDEEIFGPVMSIKHIKNFEEGLEWANNNQYANGSSIFTQNGYYAREFTRRTHGGMAGVNVGIPVPVSHFSFTGHKRSFIGDLHLLGKDGVLFYTETKTVTTYWVNEEKEKENKKVDTWDGGIGGAD